jgi:5-methylcytosine-specific restriction endonuclease McrA
MPNTNPEEHKAYCKAYRKKNLEKVKADIRLWHKKHKEELKAKAKLRMKNPKVAKRHAKQTREWRKKHPRFYAIRAAVRRTRKTKAGGSFTLQQWTTLCNKYGNVCLCCGKHKKLTTDHVIPISKGGSSNISNIQPLCLSCNSHKHTGTTDFRKTQKTQNSEEDS